ncbi:MAG: flotillin family protein [Erysipelotrichaceae bacterium]|nr:flotillin family protein [Erysipelotrichaceae bacterium]MBR2701723.1 flotillin family protein [Erysipelotrichaceae bacterium]
MEKIIPFVIAAAIVIAVIAILMSGYVKASPDVAVIISGLNRTPRVLIGRAGIKVPFFEKVDHLHLGQISVDIKTDSYIPTNDFINVKVDAIAKVRIDTSAEGMLKAERNFLNKEPNEIALELQDSLQGNMREIIGTLDLKTINTDRDSFSDQVMTKASKDMEKLGIEILSCNIQNVTDENGLINDLGMDNTSKIKKDAQIARAEADRDVAIAKALADKAANDARVAAETEIAKKNNELAIQQAELKLESDRKIAMADAAYEIQKQEQQKTIQTATVNAQIARAEREAELKQKEVEIRQQELTATVEKQADADKYAKEQEAEAKMIQLKKEAEANRYIAQMEAEAIEAKGKAEAEAIRLKGMAEAEAMEKKAEAYQKYNGAAMAEMMIRIMPQLAAEIAKPISAIDKVTIYEGGSGESGVAQVSGNMPVIMKQVFDTMSEATGVDLREIMKANTYDAKVNKNINVTGLENNK